MSRWGMGTATVTPKAVREQHSLALRKDVMESQIQQGKEGRPSARQLLPALPQWMLTPTQGWLPSADLRWSRRKGVWMLYLDGHALADKHLEAYKHAHHEIARKPLEVPGE